MASIALSVVRCIDYLAYGAIFTRVMFLPKKKLESFWIFFPARKAQDVRREEVGGVVDGRARRFQARILVPG
jgi:hypothetical protein